MTTSTNYAKLLHQTKERASSNPQQQPQHEHLHSRLHQLAAITQDAALFKQQYEPALKFPLRSNTIDQAIATEKWNLLMKTQSNPNMKDIPIISRCTCHPHIIALSERQGQVEAAERNGCHAYAEYCRLRNCACGLEQGSTAKVQLEDGAKLALDKLETAVKEAEFQNDPKMDTREFGEKIGARKEVGPVEFHVEPRCLINPQSALVLHT